MSAARRLAALAPPAPGAGRPGVRAVAGTGPARVVVALLLGTQVALVLGGWVGVVAGAVAAAVLRRWLERLEPLATRRRRQRVRADLPLAADLLVAALQAGRPLVHAVAAVGRAVGGPLGSDLEHVTARLELGGDPRQVWAEVSEDPVLGSLGRAVARAGDTGAPLADAVRHLGDDLRRERAADSEAMAHAVAVRSAGPLGLCFLPAFVLVGVAPTVVGAFGRLLG